MNLRNLLSLLVMLFMLGCMKEVETQDDKQIKADNDAVKQYIENNAIVAERDASGFYYAPITTNPSGNPVFVKDTSKIISLKYKISRLDGTLLEETAVAHKAMHNVFAGVRSMYNRALNPIGIDLGLSYMREGEKFLFILPSYLGYYNYSKKDTLPAYANLVAEVEVVKVWTAKEQRNLEKETIEAYLKKEGLDDAEALASGLYYIKLEEGEGEDKAIKGKNVKVNYIGTFLDGSVFDQSKANQPLTFMLGQGQVIEGWDEGIALMKEGEKGKLIIPSHLAYYQSVFTLPTYMTDVTIPPFSILVFDVELIDIL